jgi:hypothetical protein
MTTLAAGIQGLIEERSNLYTRFKMAMEAANCGERWMSLAGRMSKIFERV